MKLLINTAVIVATAFLFTSAMTKTKKDIVDVAISSKVHTTLVKAIKAADLVTTLKGMGPFTVFAPTNTAFSKLPSGTLTNLLKPENQSKLVSILTYHVVSGTLNANDILVAIQDGGGKALLTTVSGGSLTAKVVKGKVVLIDAKGNKSTVTNTNLEATNGVIHVIDRVLLPND